MFQRRRIAALAMLVFAGSFSAYAVDEGSVWFENATYQGCQVGALVYVQDKDLTGATVPIRVFSTTDPKGFTMQLKKGTDPGYYADSIHFNINKTDSAKQTIKVLDQDNVTITYNEAAPARIDSNTVQWTGANANVNPGASIYTGIRNGIVVNVYDPDVTDDYVILRVFSKQQDTVGVNAKLFKSNISPGSYSRNLKLTFGPKVGDSVVSVSPAGDNDIKMVYTDLTPAGDRWGSILTWKVSPATITLDSARYVGTTQKMNIVFSDDDITDNTIAVKVKSKKDPTGINATLTYVAKDQTFNGSVGFSLSASSQATGTIAVQNNDSVTVSYQDDSPPSTVVKSAIWKLTNSVIVPIAMNGSFSTPMFRNNQLSFSVSENDQQVKVDLYSLTGKHVATVANGKLSKGAYRVSLQERSLAGQAYVIKLLVGEKVTSFKVLNAGN
jgi:hypothetical protein